MPEADWIVIGPGLGALLATAFYKLLLAMKYQEANPTQDLDSPPPMHLMASATTVWSNSRSL